MSFIFMTVHYPKPECREKLLQGMTEMAAVMAKVPGFIEAGPWQELDAERIVGISRWESREAFLAAVPPRFGQPSSDVHEWETRPREPFHIEPAAGSDSPAATTDPASAAREDALTGLA